MKKIVLNLVSIGVLLLSGCAGTSPKTRATAESLGIVKGKTTLQELQAKLGKPDSYRIFEDGSKKVFYKTPASNNLVETKMFEIKDGVVIRYENFDVKG